MMHGSDEMMQLNREIHQTELDMEHALQEGDIEKARTWKETRESLQASREKLEKKNRRVSKTKFRWWAKMRLPMWWLDGQRFRSAV